MKFGVYLSTVGKFSSPTLLADLTIEAEEIGWDGVFIWDHIGQPHQASDPWVTLAAMAVVTERVRLGTVVTPVARRRPWKLARETVTLDHLSGGRVTLGVGLGWTAEEFTVFGESGDSKIRAEKLDEGLEVLDGLWTGEPFSYDGKHYQVEGAHFLPPPLQQPRIPIWACGAWCDKRAPFRRGARWDGVVAIAGPGENRAIRPDEIADIRAYIGAHREGDAPFDIVVILWSEGDQPEVERQETTRYADAGATWWLEDLSLDRFSTLEEIRERLHKGPPGRMPAP